MRWRPSADRDRACVCLGRHSLQAQGRPARRSAAAGESHLGARGRSVRDPRRHPLDGAPAVSFRLTLCRCGASKNKPFCDGSHHEVNFAASGEPPTGKADMLPVRDGPLAIDPLTDGPLQVRGNMEIISGTGRVVARLESARLCRCGASNNKPFCDGSHARVGFK